MHRIQNIFHENRFRLFLVFCQENNIEYIEQLNNIDFDTLYSVRGLGERKITDIKNKYQYVIQGNLTNETLEPGTNIKTLTLKDTFHTSSEGLSAITDKLKIENVFYENKFNQFVAFCQDNGIEYLEQLQDLRISTLYNIRGIGETKVRNILIRLQESLDNHNLACEFPNIHQSNLSIEIEALRIFGLSNQYLERLKQIGIKNLEDISRVNVQSLSNINANMTQKLIKALDYFKDPLNEVINKVFNLTESDPGYIALTQRVTGSTLQEIADQTTVTRESIRQITKKTSQILKPYTKSIFLQIAHRESKCHVASLSDISMYLDNADQTAIVSYILRHSEEYTYLGFAEKFLLGGPSKEEVNHYLHQISDNHLGQASNLYEKLDDIQEDLSAVGYNFLDSEDYIAFLVAEGNYTIFNNYVVKRSTPYTYLCKEIIRKHFPKGILFSDRDSIKQLRELTEQYFRGCEFPSNDRTLATRLANSLVLCGKNKYTTPENTRIKETLLEEIVAWIDTNDLQTISYTEIFKAFEAELQKDSNVNSGHYLHGVLRHFYPDSFQYERDTLTKKDTKKAKTHERIADLILANAGPLSKEELKTYLPGLTDAMLFNYTKNNRRLIQWDSNYYNHLNNISMKTGDYVILHVTLTTLLEQFSGYSTDNLLYNEISNKSPEFISLNKLNATNLFYIVAKLFDGEFRFRRPHIFTKEFPTQNQNAKQIMLTMLKPDKLTYQTIMSFSRKFLWTTPITSSVLSEIEEEFIRVSRDEYIRKDKFAISENSIESIAYNIDKLLTNNRYKGVAHINSYASFPAMAYEWNGFLLESITKNFLSKFKLITPQIRDRRYLRSILIRNEDHIESYDQLVAETLRNAGLYTVTLEYFENFLRKYELITNTLPKELLGSEFFTVEDNLISLA